MQFIFHARSFSLILLFMYLDILPSAFATQHNPSIRLGQHPTQVAYLRDEIDYLLQEAQTLTTQNMPDSLRSATSIYNKALSDARAIHDQGTENLILNNLGATYLNLKEYQQALTCLSQALRLARMTRSRKDQASALTNLAYVYSKTAKPLKASLLYKQAVALWHSLNESDEEIQTLKDWALVFVDENQPMGVIRIVKKVFILQRTLEDSVEQTKTALQLIRLCARLKMPRQGLNCLEAIS